MEPDRRKNATGYMSPTNTNKPSLDFLGHAMQRGDLYVKQMRNRWKAWLLARKDKNTKDLKGVRVRKKEPQAKKEKKCRDSFPGLYARPEEQGVTRRREGIIVEGGH